MTKFLCGKLLIGCSLAICVLATANDQITDPQKNTINEAGLVTTFTLVTNTNDEELYTRWLISKEERDRYLDIMSGFQGVWYKHITPLKVLAINARNEKELAGLAERAFMAEHDRLERELGFQKAYDAAANRLFPNGSIFKATSVSPQMNALPSTFARDSGFGEHYLLIVDVAKKRTAGNLIEFVLASSANKYDIYFQGVSSADDIQRWAINTKIPVDRVASKAITLNFMSPEIETAIKQYGRSKINLYSIHPDGTLNAINDIRQL